MNGSHEFAGDRVGDRLEIQHRLHQYCRAVDRLDLEALREVYHSDAHDDHGAYQGGLDGFIEWVRERHASKAFSSHHVSNIFIEFAGEDSAFVESYLLAWQSVEQGQLEAISSGRYADHFVRKHGRWAIQYRIAIPGSLLAMTEGLAPDALARDAASGSRDDDDPAQSLRRRIGLPRP